MTDTLQFSLRQILAAMLLLAIWCTLWISYPVRLEVAAETAVILGMLRIGALAGLPATYAGAIVGKLDQAMTLGVSTAVTAVIMFFQ